MVAADLHLGYESQQRAAILSGPPPSCALCIPGHHCHTHAAWGICQSLLPAVPAPLQVATCLSSPQTSV